MAAALRDTTPQMRTDLGEKARPRLDPSLARSRPLSCILDPPSSPLSAAVHRRTPPRGQTRFFLRAPRLIATKPVLIGVTERRAPQLLHDMK